VSNRWMCGHCGTSWDSDEKNLGLDNSECPHRKCHRQMDEAIKFAHAAGFRAGVEASAKVCDAAANANTIAHRVSALSQAADRIRSLAPTTKGET
jgi:hypothetical protein